MSRAVWCRRNELVALDLVITAVSTMFAFVAMIGMTSSGWFLFMKLVMAPASGCLEREVCRQQA